MKRGEMRKGKMRRVEAEKRRGEMRKEKNILVASHKLHPSICPK